MCIRLTVCVSEFMCIVGRHAHGEQKISLDLLEGESQTAGSHAMEVM